MKTTPIFVVILLLGLSACNNNHPPDKNITTLLVENLMSTEEAGKILTRDSELRISNKFFCEKNDCQQLLTHDKIKISTLEEMFMKGQKQTLIIEDIHIDGEESFIAGKISSEKETNKWKSFIIKL